MSSHLNHHTHLLDDGYPASHNSRTLVCFFLLSILGTFTLLNPVSAHPVTYEGGTAVSIINQHGVNLWHANYSLNSSFAVGVDYLTMSPAPAQTRSRYGLIRLNYLVKRWLKRGQQANVYLLSGVGGETHSSFSADEFNLSLAWMLGVQADYETRSFYTALMARGLGTHQRSIEQTQSHILYRIGFAPYQASTNELQPWLVGQVSSHQGLSEAPQFTLLMRFFVRSALWELGADTEGRPWLHFMAHF